MKTESTVVLKWIEIEKLRAGSPQQQSAISAIESLGLLTRLHPWSPALVGALPLGLMESRPQITILLSAQSLEGIERFISETLWLWSPKIDRDPRDGALSISAQFEYNQFVITIIAQDQPVSNQSLFKKFQEQAAGLLRRTDERITSCDDLTQIIY